MRRAFEILIPIQLLLLYLRFISSAGFAAVFMIRRWSMLRPLNIVLLDENTDTLIMASITLVTSALLAYRYKKFLPFLSVSLAVLSLALSLQALHLHAVSISLLSALTALTYLLFNREIRLAHALRWFLLSLVAVEALGFSGWISYILFGGINPYTEPTFLQDIEAKLVYSLSPLTPVLATTFILSTILLLIVKPLKPLEGSRPAIQLKQLQNFLEKVLSKLKGDINNFGYREGILLVSSITLPIIAVFLLYSRTLNPSGMVVSVDIVYYVDYLNSLKKYGGNIFEIFYDMMSRDRPLTYLMIYAISAATKLDFETVSIYSPIILSPLFIISVYYLTYTLFRNSFYSSLACFITATGQFTTSTIYGGFLANWLGLALAYSSLAMLIKAAEANSSKMLASSIFLSILSHMAHPVPWNFLITASLITATLMLIQKNRERQAIKTMIIYLLVNLTYDFFKTRIMGFSGGTASAQSIVAAGVSMENFINFWQINVFTVYYYVGGAFNFLPAYLLALLGFTLFTSDRSLKLDILKIWVLAGIPLYLLGPDAFQMRTLQNIPTDFFTAAGILMIDDYLSTKDKLASALFISLIYFLYLNNLIRFIANLPF